MKTIFKSKDVTITVAEVSDYITFNMDFGAYQLTDIRYKENEGFFYHSMESITKKLRKVLEGFITANKQQSFDKVVRRADLKEGDLFYKLNPAGQCQTKLLVVDKYNYCRTTKKYRSVSYGDINEYQEIDGNKLVYSVK